MSVLFAVMFALFGLWFGSRLGRASVLADSYVLDMGVLSSYQENAVQNSPDYFSDIDSWDEWQDMDDDEWEEHVNSVNESYYGSLASPSEASPSEAVFYSSGGPAMYSSYTTVYEGGIGSTILSYMQGLVEKLDSGVHYVLFRQDRYNYRLVMSSDLVYQDGFFSAPSDGCNYVLYNSYDSTVSSGIEGTFSLGVNNYTVYSDLVSPYPVLRQGVKAYEFKTLLFMVAVWFVFVLVESMFRLCVFSYSKRS